MATVERIQVIDSHTAGEPTRVVIAGGPDVGRGSMAERRAALRERFDWFRSGVVFFNNAGYLNMCGHGTIGVAVTLAYLGRIGPGTHRLETPVGVVAFEYAGGNTITIENVPSYRHAAKVTVPVEGFGPVTGDV